MTSNDVDSGYFVDFSDIKYDEYLKLSFHDNRDEIHDNRYGVGVVVNGDDEDDEDDAHGDDRDDDDRDHDDRDDDGGGDDNAHGDDRYDDDDDYDDAHNAFI